MRHTVHTVNMATLRRGLGYLLLVVLTCLDLSPYDPAPQAGTETSPTTLNFDQSQHVELLVLCLCFTVSPQSDVAVLV